MLRITSFPFGISLIETDMYNSPSTIAQFTLAVTLFLAANLPYTMRHRAIVNRLPNYLIFGEAADPRPRPAAISYCQHYNDFAVAGCVRNSDLHSVKMASHERRVLCTLVARR